MPEQLKLPFENSTENQTSYRRRVAPDPEAYAEYVREQNFWEEGICTQADCLLKHTAAAES